MLTINNVETFVTAPSGFNLLVVKITTSTPGLFGYGCATFTWRVKAVVTAIEEYLKPMLLGRNAEDIEDIWQSAMGSSYWRNGPVLNNALSGVDEALWDIKGKTANLPLYSLWGGKCRTGLTVYRHVNGDSIPELLDKTAEAMEEGYRHLRCHVGVYGGNANGRIQAIHCPDGSAAGAYYDPGLYMRGVEAMMAGLRKRFGRDLEILHDVHERLSLADTLSLARRLEQYDLYFLEDALPPEQTERFEMLRQHTTLPLAMGELFVHPAEWRGIVRNQWVDYIRVHVSAIGGLTPAKKLASFCEAYGVRTAFHGPNDLSPIGAAAQMHLDLSVPNFGIQEYTPFSDADREVFPGCPQVRQGYAYLQDENAPGIGVGFDEKAAGRYPYVDLDTSWLFSRLPDGTAVRP